MNKTILSILGFSLFLIGTISLVLTLVGLNLQFLGFLENLGVGVALIIKLLIAIFGLVLVYLVRTTVDDQDN